jgi:RimJ/RimL family protein N-acetyltransferase
VEPIRPIPDPDPPLAGAGFVLRWLRLGDIDAVLDASADAGITRFTFLASGMSRHDAVEWIQQTWRDRATGVRARFVIADPETDAMLGWIGISFEWLHDAGQAFYALLPAARGRGVAAGALDSFTRWVFTTLGLNRIQLLIDVDNDASRAVARRVGYTEEGSLRERLLLAHGVTDVFVYSRLARDPSPDLRSSSA